MSTNDHHPHDHLFKRTFGNVRHAKGLLRTLLPAGLVGRIEWPALRVEDGTYVDAELRERQSDLLFSVPVGGRRALLYLLFEHQSSVEPLMAFRLLRYLVRIWERWLAAEPNRGAATLPAIVPLVLYHGEQSWSAAVELAELYDLEPADVAGVGPYLPRLRFILDDLTALDEEALRGRRELSLAARLAQALLRALRRERAVELLSRWIGELRLLEQEADGLSELGTLIYYVWAVRDLDERGAVEAFMQENLGEKVGIAVRTIADSYRAEGWVKGRQEGREEGREKGREEGREEGRDAGRLDAARRAVLTVFAARGMAVPRDVRERVEACSDLDLLAVWLTRAVKAESAEQIFDP